MMQEARQLVAEQFTNTIIIIMKDIADCKLSINQLWKTENLSEWICDDRPRPMETEVAAMRDEELEEEFQHRFGHFLSKNAHDNRDQ